MKNLILFLLLLFNFKNDLSKSYCKIICNDGIAQKYTKLDISKDCSMQDKEANKFCKSHYGIREVQKNKENLNED